MVNRSLRIEKKAGDSDPNVLLYPQNVTFANYFYFLWAPTLVYQINYPRTKKIRLRYTPSFMSTRHAMPPITHLHIRTQSHAHTFQFRGQELPGGVCDRTLHLRHLCEVRARLQRETAHSCTVVAYQIRGAPLSRVSRRFQGAHLWHLQGHDPGMLHWYAITVAALT